MKNYTLIYSMISFRSCLGLCALSHASCFCRHSGLIWVLYVVLDKRNNTVLHNIMNS